MSLDTTDLASPFGDLLAGRRRAVAMTSESLVEWGELDPGRPLPGLARASAAVDPATWGRDHRPEIERRLLHHGAILFRGFGLTTVADFETFAAAIYSSLFGDYGDLPKEELGERVYHSTPYPPDKTILFHNEASHTERWPMRQLFFCETPSPVGGETPIVDCRQIYRDLRPEVLAPFAERGLLYVRNFTPGLDVGWQDFFRTDARAEVEERCREAGIACEWRADGGLRICQASPAVAAHPQSGEPVFFNQIQLHHPACLEPEARRALVELYGERELPRNVLYGDGAPIPDEVVAEVLDLYVRSAAAFRWQRGDVLLVDNMLVAHSRNPFEGPRKIVVAMGEMMDAARCTPAAREGR